MSHIFIDGGVILAFVIILAVIVVIGGFVSWMNNGSH